MAQGHRIFDKEPAGEDQECDQPPGNGNGGKPAGGAAEPFPIGIGVIFVARQSNKYDFGRQLRHQHPRHAEDDRHQQMQIMR